MLPVFDSRRSVTRLPCGSTLSMKYSLPGCMYSIPIVVLGVFLVSFVFSDISLSACG